MTHITVCDTSADNEYVEAEYATSMLGIHTVADSNGAALGCGQHYRRVQNVHRHSRGKPHLQAAGVDRGPVTELGVALPQGLVDPWF